MPWKPYHSPIEEDAFARFSFSTNESLCYAIVYRQCLTCIRSPCGGKEEWFGTECGIRAFSSKEEAMEETDKRLEQNGYVCLTQEQYDKLQILL